MLINCIYLIYTEWLKLIQRTLQSLKSSRYTVMVLAWKQANGLEYLAIRVISLAPLSFCFRVVRHDCTYIWDFVMTTDNYIYKSDNHTYIIVVYIAGM